MRWSFYRVSDGLLIARTYTGAEVGSNTPPGCKPIPGHRDYLSERVDIAVEPPPPVFDENGNDISPEWFPPVVDYQPPAPADTALATYAWDAATKRWMPSPTLLAIKKAKLQELAGAWQTEFRAGMVVGAFAVPTHADAIADYLLLRQIAAEGDWINTPIELADGSFQVITQAQAAALWTALKSHRRTLLAKLRDKAALVQAAADAAAVAAITWTSTP